MPYVQLGVQDHRGYGVNIVSGRYNSREQFVGYSVNEDRWVKMGGLTLELHRFRNNK